MLRRFSPCHALGIALLLAPLLACGEPECLTGEEDGCVIPSPCNALRAACESGVAQIRILEPGDALPGGPDALASPGDFLLENDRVRVVIDGLGHPHHLAASGGSILDITRLSNDVDALAQIAQATSLRPGETVVYDRYRVFEGDGFAALQVRGHLEDDVDVRVSTRYELRACEGGIRVRTELTNGSSASRVAALGDAFLWGGRGHRPFVPAPAAGFEHGETDDEVRTLDAPFLATAAPSAGTVAIGCVPCNAQTLSGFHRDELSFVGLPSEDIGTGEKVIFERLVIVGDGPSVSDAADVALDAREVLFGEATVEVRGVVTPVGAGGLGDETRATVLVRDASSSTPWTQVTPQADGSFSARIPANGEFVVEAHSFGRAAASLRVTAASEDIDVGTLAVGAAGTVRIALTVDGAPASGLVVIEPADAATSSLVLGRRFGQSPACAPLLGPPHGGSPACNRVVVHEAGAEIAAPPGAYFATAYAGPFASVARARVDVVAGGMAVADLALVRLPLDRDLYFGIDLHTHGPASFDAVADEATLVGAALAADLDVIAFTDTDAIGSFDDAVAETGALGRLIVLAGVESASLVPFALAPGNAPRTSGRYGFVPLARVGSGPWRGAPLDEATLPGLLFTRTAAAGFSVEDGFIEMLHSFDEPFLGRDRSFARAVGLDARQPLGDGAGNALFTATPSGSRFSNADYDLAEVVSGSALSALPAYRALHHYLLSENLVRVGTANGGAHGIADGLPGSPRTLVPRALVAGTTSSALALALSEGSSIGTNGPIVDASLVDASGITRGPSVSAIVPGTDPRVHVRVTAAPWVPVDEVRVIVNGAIVAVLRAELAHPSDPFGVDGLLRYEGEVSIASALPVEFGDAWVVVEAGAPLVAAADLDCDGIPDTGDNDGSGMIDARDVGVRSSDTTPSPDVTGAAEVCLEVGGPLREPRAPGTVDEPHHVFAAVTANAIAFAFTSPIFLDLDGGGYGGAPRGLTP